MSRPGTSRLKVNPPLGALPVLQFCMPAQLQVDPAYQRSLAAEASQKLIRKIAQHWDWGLCLPLVVARRETGDLFVIDGQHRLEAARRRSDISQLPCVIGDFRAVEDEAAAFVHLNQNRRALSKLDVFKAAVASGDEEACAVAAAIEAAGLTLAPHSNYTAWKPGMVSNIGGIQKAWREYGEIVTTQALIALEQAFHRQVLRYAGTIFPGIVAICTRLLCGFEEPSHDGIERLSRWVGARRQEEWRSLIMQYRAEEPGLRFADAAAAVFNREWSRRQGTGAKPALKFEVCRDGKAWCDQCDVLVTRATAEGCKSRFCPLRSGAV